MRGRTSLISQISCDPHTAIPWHYSRIFQTFMIAHVSKIVGEVSGVPFSGDGGRSATRFSRPFINQRLNKVVQLYPFEHRAPLLSEFLPLIQT